MSQYYITNGELYHYGVKGMKWGVKKAVYDSMDRDQRRAQKKKYRAEQKESIARGRQISRGIDRKTRAYHDPNDPYITMRRMREKEYVNDLKGRDKADYEAYDRRRKKVVAGVAVGVGVVSAAATITSAVLASKSNQSSGKAAVMGIFDNDATWMDDVVRSLNR